MRYLVFILSVFIPFFALAQQGQATSLSISSVNPTTCPTGSTGNCYASGTSSITFIISGVPQGTTEVSLYWGTTQASITNFIDTLTINSTSFAACPSGTATGNYCYTWNNVPQTSGTSYYVAAYPGAVNNTAGSSTTINGVIDMVASPALNSTNPVLSNPAQNTVFGENPVVSGTTTTTTTLTTTPTTTTTNTWIPGDEQMCMANWPYNGATSAFPDGTCEWTDSSSPPSAQTITSTSTLDSIDDTMHTLSDFDKWAQSILNQNVATLSSTFDTWYPQAAAWIAPACISASSSCTKADFDDNSSRNCVAGVSNPCNLFCSIAAGMSSSDNACNTGTQNGRLLNIYEPANFPWSSSNTAMPSSVTITQGSVDQLNAWNTVITNWLNTSFTPSDSTSSTLWCVPQESTASGMCVAESNGTTIVPTNEDTYINNSASTGSQCGKSSTTSSTPSTWGNVTDVLACLNYNAGPQVQPANYSTYDACLNALTSGACPASLEALPGACYGISPPASVISFNSSTGCDVYVENSFANWLANQINFGPVYNYQNCLNFLQAHRNQSSAAFSLSGTVCDPSVLGRSMIACYNGNQCSAGTCGNSIQCGTPPPFYGVCDDNSACGSGGSNECHDGSECYASFDPSYTYLSGATLSGDISYAQWINQNLTIFTDEQPKFALRYAFLKDVYSRAQTLQTSTAQADVALHNFFKPCDGCADGTACSGGTCDDGSACGQSICANGTACTGPGTCSDGSECNQCFDGGPAAQLIYQRSQGNPVVNLPNSVVYGWIDNPPQGSGGCLTQGSNGQMVKTGCAHIVRVKAFFPGRNGSAQNNDTPAPFVQPVLPWIRAWSTFLTQDYSLTNSDGYVYASIQRWDQDHTKPLTFPNGHTVWQTINHPVSNVNTGQQPSFADCDSTYGGLVASPGIGYGLMANTVQGLENAKTKASPQDMTSLANAFMLNDSGNGQVDPNVAANSADYKNCMSSVVVPLLAQGIQTQACAKYIAAAHPSCSNPADPTTCGSNNDSNDYSVLFVNCNSIDGGTNYGINGSP